MLDITTLSSKDEEKRRSRSGLVTKISQAVRDKNRVNVYIDNEYFCSLDISQVVDFHLKEDMRLNEDELQQLKTASDFGKFYACALRYVFVRSRSSKEIRDYLKRKTLSRKVRVKNSKTGEYQIKEKPGYSVELVEPVFERLKKYGYVDDERFAKQWIENRNITKGISRKKLILELQRKGIDSQVIERTLSNSDRDDLADLRKIIAKKQLKYDDKRKLIQYLLRLGFDYSDVLDELSLDDSSD